MHEIEKNIHKLMATVYRDLSNIESELRRWKPNEEKYISMYHFIRRLKTQLEAYYNNLFFPLALENTWMDLTTD